jgi:hypothetical protein
VEALKEKGTRGSKEDEKTQFITQKKSGAFLSFTPPLKANVLFCRFFWNLTRFQTKLRVVVLRLPDFTENSDKSTHPLQAFCSLNA